jgi:diaminopimelate decarboxylase
VDFKRGASKRKIRDHIRRLPNGEIEWQKCQALLYGPRISEAKLIEGVPQFFELCRQHGMKVYVVSHKTEFSRFDNTGTNLRTAALAWMSSNAFFEPNGLGLTEGSVFFADSRQEKIDRICTLQCTDFVDDLEETFLEATFPPSTARILYEPGRESAAPAGVLLMRTWQEISDYFFHSN